MSEGKIVKKLLEHDDKFMVIEEQLKRMLTREEYLRGQDQIMVILKRLDQESQITSYNVRKFTEMVERHELKLMAS